MMILFQRKILPNSRSSRKLWSAVYISVIRSAQIYHSAKWLTTSATEFIFFKNGAKILKILVCFYMDIIIPSDADCIQTPN